MRMSGDLELNMSARKAWEMYRDDKIISKINPEMLSGAEYIEGDGGPGSLRRFTLGPAVSEYVHHSIQKIEEVCEGRSVTYSVIDGVLRELYDPYRVSYTFKPIAGKEDEKCNAEWSLEFEPIDPTTASPERARDVAVEFLRFFDKFLS